MRFAPNDLGRLNENRQRGDFLVYSQIGKGCFKKKSNIVFCSYV